MSDREGIDLDSMIMAGAVESDEDRPQTVVRLSRSMWHDKDGAYSRTTIRYMKRHTRGYNVFDEDCKNIGAQDVIPRIVNLDDCEDGVYQLIMCDERKDWETGYVEDWDYKLIAFDGCGKNRKP